MTAVFNILIPLLAIVAIGATIYYGLRAFRYKTSFSRQPYNVGQQHTHRAMQLDMLRAGAFLIVAFMMLILVGFSQISTSATDIDGQNVIETEPVEEETSLAATATVDVPIVIPQTAVAIATATTPPLPTFPPLPTEQPTIPTITPLPLPPSAIVTSEVGVWLRSEPTVSSEQIEWLLDGTVLVLLDGKQSGDDLEWQRVQAASGNEGWVATLFITYNE